MARFGDAVSAGKEYCLNPWTIRRMGYENKIKVYRNGASVRYDLDEIQEYMRKQGEACPVIPRPRKKP